MQGLLLSLLEYVVPRLHLCKWRILECYVKIKHSLRHENKVNENKVLSYCEALRYMQQHNSNNENLLSIMSTLQINCHFKQFSKKWGQHTGGKWLIYGTIYCNGNQLQSLELPCSTVETLYSTIYYSKYFIELNFDKSTQYVALWTHKRHPIPRPFGRAMECLLWVLQQKLTVL